VARRLRGHQRHVHAGRRDDLVVVDVEAVGEHQRVARLQVRGDAGLVDRLLRGVGQQDHHDLRGLGRLGHRQHLEPRGLRLLPRAAALVEPDDHLDAALLEVERVRVALAAVADDGDLLALECAEVRVLVIEDGGHREAP
jgi:hypothetical protein